MVILSRQNCCVPSSAICTILRTDSLFFFTYTVSTCKVYTHFLHTHYFHTQSFYATFLYCYKICLYAFLSYDNICILSIFIYIETAKIQTIVLVPLSCFFGRLWVNVRAQQSWSTKYDRYYCIYIYIIKDKKILSALMGSDWKRVLKKFILRKSVTRIVNET